MNIKIYFICMGNYYRSRLAEELFSHYAGLYNISANVDSGGIDKIPNPMNVGTIGTAVIEYLRALNITPRTSNRLPKNCSLKDLESSDYIICTYEKEQRKIFENQFPRFKNKVIYWNIPDSNEDPNAEGPDRLHLQVMKFIAMVAREQKKLQ